MQLFVAGEHVLLAGETEYEDRQTIVGSAPLSGLVVPQPSYVETLEQLKVRIHIGGRGYECVDNYDQGDVHYAEEGYHREITEGCQLLLYYEKQKQPLCDHNPKDAEFIG